MRTELHDRSSFTVDDTSSGSSGPIFEFIERHRALTDDDYWFEIDEYKRGGDQLLLAHIRVARWSPSVCKRIDKQWAMFRQCVTSPLFACGELDDDKWARFVSRLGFKFFQHIPCEDGEHRQLYIHRRP